MSGCSAGCRECDGNRWLIPAYCSFKMSYDQNSNTCCDRTAGLQTQNTMTFLLVVLLLKYPDTSCPSTVLLVPSVYTLDVSGTSAERCVYGLFKTVGDETSKHFSRLYAQCSERVLVGPKP